MDQLATLSLSDGLGNNTDFYILDDPRIHNQHYVVLYPVEAGDESVVIMKIEKGKGKNDNYLPIYDEKELNQVFALFQQRHPEYF